MKHTAGSPVVEGRLDFHSLFEMVTAWSQGEMVSHWSPYDLQQVGAHGG